MMVTETGPPKPMWIKEENSGRCAPFGAVMNCAIPDTREEAIAAAIGGGDVVDLRTAGAVMIAAPNSAHALDGGEGWLIRQRVTAAVFAMLERLGLYCTLAELHHQMMMYGIRANSMKS